MYEYKIIKVSVKDKEEAINKQFNDLGREGWELINFQPSAESHGVLKNIEPWTTFYIFVFKRKV